MVTEGGEYILMIHDSNFDYSYYQSLILLWFIAIKRIFRGFKGLLPSPEKDSTNAKSSDRSLLPGTNPIQMNVTSFEKENIGKHTYI